MGIAGGLVAVIIVVLVIVFVVFTTPKPVSTDVSPLKKACPIRSLRTTTSNESV